MIKKYREEIDGLRGLAVLGVIFYHAEILINNKNIFSGGFLGVDIFLVVSGFLITRIINNEYLYEKTFTFKNFYERRIRRLLPALLIVIILSTIFAYLILLPNQFIYFLKSAFSSIFFFSNIFFHYTGESYGQSILTTIPLLHTWSLSLEEQFYIFYPAFLILIFKYGKNKININLIILLLISIIFSLSINKNHGSFNFYMLPSRGWEFIVGGLLAINENKKIHKYNKSVKNFLSFLGFFLIVYSFLFFDNVNDHPGYKTILPVFGTALIILNSHSKNYINLILSNKILKKLGLISYSLYLWHHPIFSFSKIIGLNDQNIFIKFLLFILSIILAYLSYRYVERFFRNKNVSFKKIFISFSFLIVGFLIISNFLVSYQVKNFPNITKDLYEKTWFTTKQYFKPCFQRKKYFCEFNINSTNQNLYLVGDSIMASIQEELKTNLINKKINFISMTNAGCDFIKKDEVVSKTNVCNNQIYQLRKNKILESKQGIIVMHLNYKKKISKSERKIFLNEINNFLQMGYKVIFIYPIPHLNQSVSVEIDKIYKSSKNDLKNYLNDFENYISIDFLKFKEDSQSIFELLNSIDHKNLYSIYPHSIFCNTNVKNKCIGHSKNDIFYIDGSHLSKAGSNLINKELLKIINKIYN